MSSFRKVKIIVGSIEYDFWQLLSSLITYLKPLVGLLKLTDSNEPYFSKMYVKCRQLQEYYYLNSWEGMTDFEKYSVNGSINNRFFLKLLTPIYLAAYYFDPEYASKFEESTDAEINSFRKALSSVCDKNDSLEVFREWQMFYTKQNHYSQPEAWKHAPELSPREWWLVYGSRDGKLRSIALRILSQSVSTGSAERNWSAYGFIKNKRRNRLSDRLANDLVFIFSNMKLKKTLENKKESYLKWETDPMEADWVLESESDSEVEDPCLADHLKRVFGQVNDLDLDVVELSE
ncbi:hypothetical protein P9112_006506 [Eukaryota sp. TZLM1-RC]